MYFLICYTSFRQWWNNSEFVTNYLMMITNTGHSVSDQLSHDDNYCSTGHRVWVKVTTFRLVEGDSVLRSMPCGLRVTAGKCCPVNKQSK